MEQTWLGPAPHHDACTYEESYENTISVLFILVHWKTIVNPIKQNVINQFQEPS